MGTGTCDRASVLSEGNDGLVGNAGLVYAGPFDEDFRRGIRNRERLDGVVGSAENTSGREAREGVLEDASDSAASTASGDRGGRDRVSSAIENASIPLKLSDGGRERRRTEGAGDKFAKGSSSSKSGGGEYLGGVAGSSRRGRSGSEEMPS